MKALKTTIALGLLVSMPVQAEVVCTVKYAIS